MQFELSQEADGWHWFGSVGVNEVGVGGRFILGGPYKTRRACAKELLNELSRLKVLR